jgi:hypothetical protein
MKMPEKESDLAETGHVRALESEARDVERKLLRPGTQVLFHPLAPGQFLEDSPGNRTRFLALDCAWTEEARRRIWFPDLPGLSPGLKERLDWGRSVKRCFLDALAENLVASQGSPFPEVRAPGWINLLPCEWEPKVRSVELAADLTDRFFAAVGPRSGVRPDLAWPPEWAALVKELNTVLVYEVAGFRARAHVVMAIATPFGFERLAEPRLLALDQAYVNAVRTAYERWRTEKNLAAPDFAFFTVGSAGPLPPNLTGACAGDHWLTLSGLPHASAWEVRVPPSFSYRRSLRDFLDRLKPETRGQRVTRIKECVDELLGDGHVTVERVKRETGYRRSCVRDGFFELQRRSPEAYRVWTKDGQVAIRRATGPAEPIRITAASLGPGVLRRHGLRVGGLAAGAAVGVLGSRYLEWLGISGAMGFIVSAPILYLGSCVQEAVNRRADKDEP